ncbi:MAG: YbjN domain-containing protein [Cellvibrionaceae bacterium]
MANITPDTDLVIKWLDDIKLDNYICAQCHGIHISDIQTMEGVMDSRLFVEAEGVMASTEISIRPTGLLPLMADLGRLNMDFAHLKIFVDIQDQDLPKLIICDHLLAGAGVSQEQFTFFMDVYVPATIDVIKQCADLIAPPEGEEPVESSAGPSSSPMMH